MGLEEQIRRHWYVSRLDGARIPYLVFVPRSYRGAPVPAVYSLHGYGRDEWGGVREHLLELCERYGWLLVSTAGRGWTFYDGPGEQDFLEVWERVAQRYAIDFSRIYLVGHSMGGTGTLRLATRFPDRFAAAVALCPWSDWRLWYRRWYASAEHPRAVPWWRRVLLERASPLFYAENLLHVPLYLLHGVRDDVVSVKHSRRLYRRLRELRYEVVYKEYVRSGHGRFAGRLAAAFRWLAGQTRPRHWLGGAQPLARTEKREKTRPKAPSRIVLRVGALRHARAYWLSVEQLDDPTTPARVQTEIAPETCQGPARIALRCAGARRLVVDFGAAPLRPGEQVEVALGGAPVFQGRARGTLALERDERGRWAANPPPSAALCKAPGLEGPWGDALCDSFLVVFGDDPRERELAEQFALAWGRWTVGLREDGAPRAQARIKHAAAVTRAEVAQHNLVLFGRPRDNALLRTVLDELPVAISNDGITLAGERFRGRHFGLRLIYPNPLNPRRYVALSVGRLPLRTKDFECLPWLVPDFAVFDERIQCSRTTHMEWELFDAGEWPEGAEPPQVHLPDCLVCAGFFDSFWRLGKVSER